MSTWTHQARTTLAIRGIQAVTPRTLLGHARLMRAALRRLLAEGKNPVLAAGGAFASHATASITDEFALCGAPVFSWGGGFESVDCLACTVLLPVPVRVHYKQPDVVAASRPARFDDYLDED